MTTIATAGSGRKAAPAQAPPAAKTKAKRSEPRLDPLQSYRSAMRELIALRWGELWQALPVALAGEDIEGVHDVRVASRRLRAAMDVAVECFPAKWYRSLHEAAKEITSALGEVRDRDVMIEALGAERERASVVERPGIDHLIDRIETERATARVEMEAYLYRMIERGLPREVERRFGSAAAPPPELAARTDAGLPDAEETTR